jgi:hypothetical protein
MNADEILRHRAFHNSIGSLRPDRTFPLNVFRENWHDFLFFESDSLFEPAFIAVMNGLLDNEGSQICCLLNLGATVQENYSNPPARYLDRSTDPSQYISMLRGNGSPDAWLYLVDRYVFASDVGEWCIYCEKENDVGVIAFSGRDGTNKFSSAIGTLQATSINSAREMPREGAFRFDKLMPAWRSTLVEQYSQRQST